MWWTVEPLKDVLVDGGNACFLLVAAGSLVCCTPIVAVCCVLNCFVGEAMRWRSCRSGAAGDGHGGVPECFDVAGSEVGDSFSDGGLNAVTISVAG